MRRLTALMAALFSTVALAEADSFGLGDGHSGAYTAPGLGSVINVETGVTASAAAGDTSLTVASTTGIVAGDLLLLLQTTGLSPDPVSGTQTAIDLSTSPVGHFEWARVQSVGVGTLTLTQALVSGFAANAGQVIDVPEFTSVTVPMGTSVVAPAWNGQAGGVIAFLSSGPVAVDGLVSTLGLGDRGGLEVDDASGAVACVGLDQAAPDGAQKGEGIDGAAFEAAGAGRGNVANGAGGGVCAASGGGGGGNGGQGGQGGNSADGARAVGGLGGAPLTYSLLDHLTLGGGGGAGQAAGTGASSGAAGGGVIVVRGTDLSGAGTWSASGADASAAATTGAGGGGAGGSISMRFTGAAICGATSANGGAGGDALTADQGPGGGGAGGQLLLQASVLLACPSTVQAGLGGTQPDAVPGASYGAGPTSASDPTALGVVTHPPGPLVIPATPSVSSPADGSSGTDRTPVITGNATALADVIIFLDGAQVAETTATALGVFTFTPSTALALGSHQVAAATVYQGLQSVTSTVTTFSIDAPVIDAGVDAGQVEDAGVDAGQVEDAGHDAGTTVDAGHDAGTTVDAGHDAGTTVDAGHDAGIDAGHDAGTAVDAGHDAGTTDAGEVDAGTLGQVSTYDSGSGSSGGSTDNGFTGFQGGGCGCSGAPGAPLVVLGAVLALARRKRSAQMPSVVE